MASRSHTSGSAGGRKAIFGTQHSRVCNRPQQQRRHPQEPVSCHITHVQPKEPPPLGFACRSQGTRYRVPRRDLGRILRGSLSHARLRRACTANARSRIKPASRSLGRVGLCRPLSEGRRSACHPAATSLPFPLLHSHRACRRRHADPRSNTAPNGVKQAAKLASSSATPHGYDETISSSSGIHTCDYAPSIIPSPMPIPPSPSHPLIVPHRVAYPRWFPALSHRSRLFLPMAPLHSASTHSLDRPSC